MADARARRASTATSASSAESSVDEDAEDDVTCASGSDDEDVEDEDGEESSLSSSSACSARSPPSAAAGDECEDESRSRAGTGTGSSVQETETEAETDETETETETEAGTETEDDIEGQRQGARKKKKMKMKNVKVSWKARLVVVALLGGATYIALLELSALVSGLVSSTISVLPALPKAPSLGIGRVGFLRGGNSGAEADEEIFGFSFNPVLSEARALTWSELRGLLRVQNKSKVAGRPSEIISVPSQMPKPVGRTKHRSFGCLREGCRGLEIEDMLDRGWSMRFKTCLVNGTRDYKDINYHQTFLMADTTNLNHLQQVRPDLFTKVHSSFEGSTYISAFEGGDAIGGNKGQQLRIKMKFASKFGCKYNDLGIQPAQYRLYVKDECDDLVALDGKDLGLTWLLKPEAGSQGQGITFHTNAADVQAKRPEFFPCETRHKIPATSRALVQEYIEQPLLLDKCKFDVRVYLLVGRSNPWLVFYHEGYLRRSLWPYSPNSKDRKVYLTNTHFQSMKAGFKLSDHIWPFHSFQRYLSEQGITGAHYIDAMLNPYIRAVALYVFNSAVHKMRPRAGSYQIMGLDFMIDEKFHVHFIEANGYPGFTWSINFDSRKMVEHLHDLVQELHEHPEAFPLMRPGDRFASWQLIHSDVTDKLRGRAYDACEAFADNMALTAPLRHANEVLSRISGAHKKASTAAFDDESRFVPRVPGWRYIGGEKGDTFGVRQAFASAAGCKLASLGIEPRTYRLYEAKECAAFFAKETAAEDRPWVLKQVEGAGEGDGLVFFSSAGDVRGDPGLFPCDAEDRPATWLAQAAVRHPLKLDVAMLRKAERIKLLVDSAEDSKERRKNAEALEQDLELINPDNQLYRELTNAEMAEKALLVQYDVRAYMLIASVEPLMVFYHDGFMRSSRPVQVDGDAFGFKLGEHLITMESFQYYLASQGITGPHYVSSVLRPFMLKVMEFVLHSARPGLKSALAKAAGGEAAGGEDGGGGASEDNGAAAGRHFHHLFAFNFGLTKDFAPRLLGVSGDPDHAGLLDPDAAEEVSVEVADTLRRLTARRRELVLEIAAVPGAFARMGYGDAYGSFTLLFSEMEEIRTAATYDPCLYFGDKKGPPRAAQLKKAASLHNFLAKQRASHKREMDKYVKKRWASCKLRSSKEAKEACIRGEIIFRYMVFVQKERIPYDPDFVANTIHELEGVRGPQLPQWKVEAAKAARKS